MFLIFEFDTIIRELYVNIFAGAAICSIVFQVSNSDGGKSHGIVNSCANTELSVFLDTYTYC